MKRRQVQLNFNRFPGGMKKALVMSYDDGKIQDIRLTEIFRSHGIRGTFHLSSERLGLDGFVRPEDVSEVYRGHEVSVHTCTHPWLSQIPLPVAADEILQDRKNLEMLVGYPVRGMSYPFGDTNPDVIALLGGMGMAYARNTRSHGGFHLPDRRLDWAPTCHHNDRLMERGRTFLEEEDAYRMRLMHVWGHSSEFEKDKKWDLAEEFSAFMGDQTTVWSATQIEVADYLTALERLQSSIDMSVIFNPTAMSLWFCVNGQTVSIAPGGTLRF